MGGKGGVVEFSSAVERDRGLRWLGSSGMDGGGEWRSCVRYRVGRICSRVLGDGVRWAEKKGCVVEEGLGCQCV